MRITDGTTLPIIDEELLRCYRGAGRCEACGRQVRNREAAHVFTRGHGGGRRWDSRYSLVALCATFAGGKDCHYRNHNNGHPTQDELLAIVAEREGVRPEWIASEFNRLRFGTPNEEPRTLRDAAIQRRQQLVELEASGALTEVEEAELALLERGTWPGSCEGNLMASEVLSDIDYIPPAIWHSLLFTESDAKDHWEAWGCNCGPSALAAVLGITLQDVFRAADVVHFPYKRYTSPTMMKGMIAYLGAELRANPIIPTSYNFPNCGVARIQWEGPWSRPGSNPKWGYRQTHWIGCWTPAAATSEERIAWIMNPVIFDVNGGLRRFNSWENEIVPAIIATIPRANGKWRVTHSWEIVKAEATRAGESRPEKAGMA